MSRKVWVTCISDGCTHQTRRKPNARRRAYTCSRCRHKARRVLQLLQDDPPSSVGGLGQFTLPQSYTNAVKKQFARDVVFYERMHRKALFDDGSRPGTRVTVAAPFTIPLHIRREPT